MTTPSRTITIYAQDAEESAAIAEVLRGVPDLTVKRCAQTLTRANGTAVSLARAGNIIVFRTGRTADEDLDAARQLCRLHSGKVIAISDCEMPLSEARKLRQAGVADVLPAPVSAEDMAACLARLSGPAQGPAASEHRGKIVAIAHSRGGIGATTFAVNLADALRGEKGLLRKVATRKIAVVDLDVQFGSVASFLDVEPNDALFLMARDQIQPDATFVSQAMSRAPCGLSVLAAPSDLMPLDALKVEQVSALLDQLSLQFDFVVVDLPRILVGWISAVLGRSDLMYLVTDSTVPAIRQAKRLIDIYAEDNPTLPIEMVINQEARPLIRGRHHVQAAKLLERPLCHWLPPDPKPVREALDRGQPLSAIAPGGRLARAVRRIAKTVTAGTPLHARPAAGAGAVAAVAPKFSTIRKDKGEIRV